MAEVDQKRGRAGGRRVLVPIAIGVAGLAADQATKWLVADRLGPGADSHRFEVLGDLLAVHYVENRGVAFGLFQGQALIATLLAVVVLAFLVRAYRDAGTASWRVGIGCGLIVGGAIGNLADRLRLGYVVDFVAVSSWPKFNVADSAITIGALFLVWHYLRDQREEHAGERDGGSAVPPGLVLLRHDGER
jgi:signal peptidase II